MKNVLFINFAVLILFALSFSAFAQSDVKIERELVAAIREVKKYSTYGGSYDDVKLAKANDVFEKKMANCAKNPATLGYKFKELEDYLHLSTSADGKFRVYSWDTEDGGTMHFFKTVYQFRGNDNKVYAKSVELPEGDSGSFVLEIYQLKTAKGVVYPVRNGAIAMSSLYLQNINLFKIDGNRLNEQVKLFKTKEGLTNSIGFEYGIQSVIKDSVLSFDLIKFDEKTKTVKIPVVIKQTEEDFGTVTDKFINYRFNGIYFIKTN